MASQNLSLYAARLMRYELAGLMCCVFNEAFCAEPVVYIRLVWKDA